MAVKTNFRWQSPEPTLTLFPDEQLAQRHAGKGEYRDLEFIEVDAKTIINEVRGNRRPFQFTINAYRGCSHACTYCFARPTHKYLDLNIGEDFDKRIVVKINAVERLRAELRSKQWQGDLIAMGTNTDPYQKAEGKYHLTRRIVEVLTDFRNPFSILTKSTLIARDLDVLSTAHSVAPVTINFSIGTLDRDVWKLTEPGTPPPDKRIEVVRKFKQAGIQCGILIAPILPGLSDSEEQIQTVVEACQDAGGRVLGAVPLHLRPGVRDHYLSWIATARPDLAARYNELFNNRSYQPKEEHERIMKIVNKYRSRKAITRRSRKRPKSQNKSKHDATDKQLRLLHDTG